MKGKHAESFLDYRVPPTPRFLIFAALLFVPGVYLVLLGSAALSLVFSFEVFRLFSDTADKSNNTNIPALIALGALIVAYACIRGIWIMLFRKSRFELAMSISSDQQPRLWSLVRQVCRTLRTSEPDAVILHAEPTFFVQTGKLKVINGKVERKVLSIGLPSLNTLSTKELRAILAHEFAHFTGNDTLYSSLVLPIYLGTQASMNRLLSEIRNKSETAQSAIAGFFIKMPMFIPYAIIFAYLKLFQLLDMKLSRMREKRADYIAAIVCGSEAFSNSLRKVTVFSRAFYSASRDQIIDLLKEDKIFVNCYSAFRSSLPQLWESFPELEAATLSEKEELLSSHPLLRTRLEYVPSVPDRYHDAELAANLIDNLETYEENLTAAYTEFVSLLYSKEIQKRKQRLKATDTRPVAYVKCPHCHMRTYEGKRCHVCGKRLKSIFDALDL